MYRERGVIMRRNKAAFLWMCLAIVAAIVFISHAVAEEAKEIACTGKVVDTKGRPIAGARVILYRISYDYMANTTESKLTGEVKTTGDGVFSFKAVIESDSYPNGYIVAGKEGLALGWADWEMRDNQQQDIILGEPKELSGMVVDEAGKPVADADVSVWLIAVGEGQDQQRLGRPVAEKLLTEATDASGRFTFTNIPAEATADFIIRKAGRATLRTYLSTGHAHQKMTFASGQSDIKLVLPAEARIQGTVVAEDTANPAAGTKLIVKTQENRSLFGQQPVISKDDGTFSIDALAAGNYLVQLVRPHEGLADWVAEPVNVTLEAGQTKKNVKIELRKGGLLEVLVAEAGTNKLLAKASVSIRDEKNNQWLSASSNEDGIASIRLVSGSYQFSRIYMRGYKSKEPQETFTLKDGGIKRLKYQLTSQPKINGVVRDENGKPVQDAILKICPMGGRDEIRSDVEGKFEITWDPGMWGSRERDAVFCLVARHEKRNLAAAVEIGQDIKTVDIRLKAGVTFTGRVVDPNGKGIPDAQIRAMLRVSNWGSPLSNEQIKTDDSGNYELSAIPAGHKYNIYASAKGYGQKDIDVHADDALDNLLNMEIITLPLANLSVSGQIVDIEGNPVPDARVEGSGDDQPRPNTLADEQGNFTLDGLCEGTVYIRADVSRDGKRLSARVHTDAGASGISIVVREGRPVSYYIGAKTYEQIIRSSDKVIAGVTLDENGSPVAGVPVCVCCIKRQREIGKFSWTYSSYSTLSNITDEQGRFAIELEEDAEYNLRFSPDNQAAIIIYDIPIGKKDLKVTLPDGGTLNGRLLRMEKGKKVPVPHAEVKIQQTDRASYTHLGFDRDRTTVTDSEGRFRFEHIRTKIRPRGSRSDKSWDPVPRVWEILYGDTSKTIAFYDGMAIEDFELVVKPSLTDTQSLVGGALPGFDSIKIDYSADMIKDKSMLVCFFDMNQRPSRNTILQLARKAEELKQKDLAVIAIQVSKITDDTLNKWIKDQSISFPVGMVQGDEEDIRFAWGVKSLPWLILTDCKHIVRAEGFGLPELSEKLKANK
jgi:protocatechuate 3,4-dioxygenase beta subunit